MTNSGPPGSHFSQFNNFTFDGVFNPTSMSASISTPANWSGNRSWTYSAKDELTNETSTQYTSGWNHNNAFDNAGNPTTFKNASRTYNADNQIVTPGTNVYDGNGNATTYNGASMVYDVENRATAIGTQLTNGYRGDGLRAWKQTSAGVRTYFLYDGGNPVLELDNTGATKNINVFAPDGLVARKEGATWTYYVFDQQGNVLHKLDSNNQPTAARLLDAWGQGVETTLPRNIDPWGYNAKWGYYYDRETSLYYCQNRFYDASTGRWLNRDPIGYAGGVNVYGYCGNRANGFADPSGLITPETFLDAAGLGVDIAEFAADPSLVGGLMVGWSALATAIPVLPGSWTLRAGKGALNLLNRGGDVAGTVGDISKRLDDCEPVSAFRNPPKKSGPELKPGSSGGDGAGKPFSQKTKADAKKENPGGICVYCLMASANPDVDHVIPKSLGGNNSPGNAQLACPHCNRSKGKRQFPVTPPKDYVGPWPPPHWQAALGIP